MSALAPSRARVLTLDRPLVVFFVLAVGIAWSAFVAVGWLTGASSVAEAQDRWSRAESGLLGPDDVAGAPWVAYLLTRSGDFALSIAGVVMIAATAGRAGLRQLIDRLTRWRISKWWYIAGLLPVGLYAVAAAVAGALPSADFAPSTLATALVSLNAGLFVSLLLRGALGEELGLRGFALPRLQRTMSPLRASFVLGVLWGTWHMPVLLGKSLTTVGAFFLVVLAASVLSTWLFNGSGGSLLPVLLFHSTVNWEEGFETFFPSLVGTGWEAPAVMGLVCAGIAVAVVLRYRGKRAD